MTTTFLPLLQDVTIAKPESKPTGLRPAKISQSRINLQDSSFLASRRDVFGKRPGGQENSGSV